MAADQCLVEPPTWVEPRSFDSRPWKGEGFCFNRPKIGSGGFRRACGSDFFIVKEVLMSDQPHHERYEDSDLFRIRHSAAHVMAQAVLELMPSIMILTCRAR